MIWSFSAKVYWRQSWWLLGYRLSQSYLRWSRRFGEMASITWLHTSDGSGNIGDRERRSFTLRQTLICSIATISIVSNSLFYSCGSFQTFSDVEKDLTHWITLYNGNVKKNRAKNKQNDIEHEHSEFCANWNFSCSVLPGWVVRLLYIFSQSPPFDVFNKICFFEFIANYDWELWPD